MFKEAPCGTGPETPLWWHEAIRNNLQGSQETPGLFRTFEVATEDGIIYEIHSLTGSEPEENRIFILATVPGWRERPDVEARLRALVSPIKALFTEEAARRKIHTEVEIPSEVSGGLAELGMKTSLDTAIGVTLGHLRDDIFVVGVSPIGLEQLKKNFRITAGVEQIQNIVIDHYFSNMSYLRRIAFVFDETVALPLRKIIIGEEIKRGEQDVSELLEKGDLALRIEADLAECDDGLAREYRLFLGKILDMKSPEDEKDLNREFDKWGVLKVIGWLKFYRKHWEEKLSST